MEANDVVQLDPETVKNPMFSGCFLVIDEIKSWGVQGYVQTTGDNGNPGGQAYYRAKFDELGPVIGKATWVVS